MRGFKQRSEEKELMDDLDCNGEVVDQTLRELDLINRKLGGNSVSIKALQKLLSKRTEQDEITVADLGCGGGDILIYMAKWARKNNLKMKFIGIDANPNIITYAKSHCKAYPEISFAPVNIFSEEFKNQKFDIIHSSLFTHHFTQIELIQLFNQLRSQTKKGVIVNDLHRHWLAYYSIKIITRYFSKSAMVQNDAAISVARGFKKTEINAFLKASGFKDFSVNWKWAFRWQILITVSDL